MGQHKRRRFSGMIAPVVTPVDEDGGLDVAGLSDVLDYVMEGSGDGGVDGILLMGSTGEGASLSEGMKREVVERGVEVCKGSSNWEGEVLIGVMSCSEVDALKLIEWSGACGADGVLCGGPFYFKVSEGVVAESLVRLVEKGGMPTMVYHFPAVTGHRLSAGLMGELMKHEGVVGMKDSSGDLGYVKEVIGLRDEGEAVVLVGPDVLLKEVMCMGGDGGVCGGANLWPGVYGGYCEAVLRGNDDVAAVLWEKLDGFARDLFLEGGGVNEAVRTVKAGMAELGLCEKWMGAPLGLIGDDGESKRVAQVIQRWGIG
ncbi:4-hydroxy-tetrahydrodipicolinate synthase [Poriferisphaera corsica]|uniref:4-hydroxy-tetrahydrodipicolinate synthase n=1 Tax=Poriferisphaera corsica TaxID=2528020 RepID=A0A517YPE2_9BACT|nr:dihydrodipicolinate synthase family protein [Poriferisphaera corsica]QDU32072.1 4-hydroxy-tetrahydrodipicolinate synthase [Poriferisphaera corsica]